MTEPTTRADDDRCPLCGGSGVVGGDPYVTFPCSWCKGTGLHPDPEVPSRKRPPAPLPEGDGGNYDESETTLLPEGDMKIPSSDHPAPEVSEHEERAVPGHVRVRVPDLRGDDDGVDRPSWTRLVPTPPVEEATPCKTCGGNAYVLDPKPGDPMSGGDTKPCPDCSPIEKARRWTHVALPSETTQAVRLDGPKDLAIGEVLVPASERDHPTRCVCGKGPHGKGGAIMGMDAEEAGPDCRPMTWKEVAEQSSQNAINRRNEGWVLASELTAAQTRIEALEAGLRGIADGDGEGAAPLPGDCPNDGRVGNCTDYIAYLQSSARSLLSQADPPKESK